MKKYLAVDIGGTFTDLVYIDGETKEVREDKVKTTPKSFEDGVLEVIRKAKVPIDEVEIFIHGTTIAMNALLEGKGAKTGLITTKGFRDVLQLCRADRAEPYNYLWKKPKPMVPRYLRLEVSERTTAEGEIIEKLDEKDVEEAVIKFKANGVETIAVCLLNSYANMENEEKVAKAVRKIWPEVPISLSYQVAREYREYERTSTIVFDAYVRKSVQGYLDGLVRKLEDMKFAGQVLVASSIGAVSVPIAKEKAISTVISGPTGGAIGAAHLGELLGIRDLVSFDVGGTSFDVSVVSDGSNVERKELELVGYPVLMPSIDIRTVGAGGGSIARVDSAGLLHVGPESAGAEPGPMCYRTGGVEPTVTDAALVNGLLNPDYFLGGKLALDTNSAKRGISNVANALGIDINKTADGILRIAGDNMAIATREILVGEGYDPKDFTILAYGGAGGIFARSVAEDIDISRVIIPSLPGIFSAWGMMSTDIVHSFVRTYICLLDEVPIEKVRDIFEAMERAGLEMLSAEGMADDAKQLVRSFDMKYEGQGYYIDVPVPDGYLSEDTKIEVKSAFNRIYEAKYRYLAESPIEIVNIRLKAIGMLGKVPVKEIKEGKTIPQSALKPRRKAYLDGAFVNCQVYERSELLCGNTIDGPAIIEEPFHTTVIMSGDRLQVDKYGNLIINIRRQVND